MILILFNVTCNSHETCETIVETY